VKAHRQAVAPNSGYIMAGEAGRANSQSCHARESAHPVIAGLSANMRQRLLDRPVKPGDDKAFGAG
jgi:hypothetical protein